MIDLHMHSKFSDDGEFEPKELVEQSAAKSVEVLSITDHNCAKANKIAAPEAAKKGIWYIPGIEIDCVNLNVNFHVLGYGIDVESVDFQQIEENIIAQNSKTSMERLEKTNAMGFHVTEAEMWAMSRGRYMADTWTGEMFAELLLQKPEYQDHPLLLPYRAGGARSDNPYVNFYWDFYAQGKPGYVEIKYPAMKDVVDLIHDNHGLAVLAHPGMNLKGRFSMLDDILTLGFDGIEAFSSYHTREDADYFCQKALEKHLLITCGSDYHGKTKPAIQIGQHHCCLPLSEIRQQLEQRLLARLA